MNSSKKGSVECSKGAQECFYWKARRFLVSIMQHLFKVCKKADFFHQEYYRKLYICNCGPGCKPIHFEPRISFLIVEIRKRYLLKFTHLVFHFFLFWWVQIWFLLWKSQSNALFSFGVWSVRNTIWFDVCNKILVVRRVHEQLLEVKSSYFRDHIFV